MHKVSLKCHQREITQKLRKGEQSFLYATQPHAINYHQDIPYGYLVMVRTRIVGEKSYQRKVIQKVRKGEQSFLHKTRRLDQIHIAMTFHSDIPYDAHKDSL